MVSKFCFKKKYLHNLPLSKLKRNMGNTLLTGSMNWSKLSFSRMERIGGNFIYFTLFERTNKIAQQGL